LTDKTNNSLKL